MMKAIPGTVELVPFLQRELSSIGIAINPSKTVASLPKEHVPPPKELTFHELIVIRHGTGGGEGGWRDHRY